MVDFNQYYRRFQGVRGGWGGMPSVGRLIIGVAAIPGIVLILLSILALIVSILALLLLTVPAYRLVRGVQMMFVPRPREDVTVVDPDGSSWTTQGSAKRVDAKVID